MKGIISAKTCWAVLTGTALFVCVFLKKVIERNVEIKDRICGLTDPKELPGKISIRLFSDGKAGPAGYGKNHPRSAAVFLP